MPHRELAPIAFGAMFSVLLPLPWHWRNGNAATISIIVWLFALNMIYAIDALLWADNVVVRAVVWCDITTKLIVGGSMALPLAGLCVCIRLYKASAARGKPDSTGMSPHRVRILESMTCYGIPVIFMALHYIVQGHRFDIVETIGCRAALYTSVPGLFLIWLPPLIFSLISLVFGVFALINLSKHYRSFVTNMRDADIVNFQLSHYIRLMIMALTQIVWVTAATSYALGFSFKTDGLKPYPNWAYVHAEFSRIWLFPTMKLRPEVYRGLYANWYLVPVSTLIFVSLFSFGEDAMVEYRKCLALAYQRCGIAWIVRSCISKHMRGGPSQRAPGILPPLQFHHPATTQNTFSVNIRTLRDVEVQERSDSLEDLRSDLHSAEKVKEDGEVC